jgi:hypothetical protein
MCGLRNLNSILGSLYFSYIVSLNFWGLNFLLFFIILWNARKFYFSERSSVFIILLIIINTIDWSVFTSHYHYNNLIKQLWVGTISLHPFLFYLVICLLSVSTLYKFGVGSTKVASTSNLNIALIGFITLCLGGFWGLQSLTWGFVWVNDYIEWILFFFTLYVVVRLHLIELPVVGVNAFYFPFFLVSFLLVLRLGIFSTRHSFLVNQSACILICFLYIGLTLSWYLVFKALRVRATISCGVWLLASVIIFLFLFFFMAFFYKFIFILMFTFYLFYIAHSTKQTNWQLHLFIVIAGVVWSLISFFFFFNYVTGWLIVYVNEMFVECCDQAYQYGSSLRGVSRLDGVRFVKNNSGTHNLSFDNHYYYSLHFNVFALLVFLILLIAVKWVEFRLLYKKKTCV